MPLSLAGRNVVQAAVGVADLPTAVDFYRDFLGLPFLFETNGMAFFQTGATRLLVGLNPDARAPEGSVLYFDAPDLDALRADLEGRGLAFHGPTQVLQRTASHELKLASFRDPDGNALALLGEVPI
jgi:catechol 2,3-dioxygenase-like lactoylglutathione lyase family enzyme